MRLNPTHTPERLERFWVIGAGRFGRLAVDRIMRRIPTAILTVVDHIVPMIKRPGVTTIRADGIDWLYHHFHTASAVDLIIPAIPVHVAAEWLKRHLSKTCRIKPVPVPDAWLDAMPNPCRGRTGQVYVSHADFICPDNCPEPRHVCTHTGKPRPGDLFRLLHHLRCGEALPVVLRSHQLLPGVGGIRPVDLAGLLSTTHETTRPCLMIATACRCHGVVDFIRVEKRHTGSNARPNHTGMETQK